MTSSEVVARDSDSAIARFLSAAQTQQVIDPEQAALDMVRRILTADSAEEVLEGREAIHAADVLGQTLTVVGVRWNDSDTAGGPGFYALMDCVDAEGQGFAVTCGAISVMAQLFRMSELNAFPVRVCIEEAAKPTKSGYRPMHLRKGEEPF